MPGPRGLCFGRRALPAGFADLVLGQGGDDLGVLVVGGGDLAVDGGVWRKREVAPGPEATTREDIREFARRSVGTYHHQVGTCKMGVDDLAVVDPQLRVRGVEGLRVADASIMPVVPSCNTNAPSIMVGEKASDLILTE